MSNKCYSYTSACTSTSRLALQFLKLDINRSIGNLCSCSRKETARQRRLYLSTRCIKHREVQLLISSSQIGKQLKKRGLDLAAPLGSRPWPVHLMPAP